jgi:peptide chain release factor 2
MLARIRYKQPKQGITAWKASFTTGPKRYENGYFNYETVFDYAGKQQEIAAIEAKMAGPGFWDNQERAQATVAELKALRGVVEPLAEALRSSEDLGAMLEMAEEDDDFASEVVEEIRRLEKKVDELELKSLLNGPHDGAGAILTINARDGGTDANDWAEMLLRMYLQWAQQNDYSVALLDRNDNEEAGINSATIAIRGSMAYGYLKGETGMHRLVRISPFNAEGKRQTSFAAVDVSPEVSDDIVIEIDDKDVREDTFKASGAGGQHVNKTSSAIRLTHMPTGYRGPVPKRAQPAQEPRGGLEDAPRTDGSRRGRKTRSRTGRALPEQGSGRFRIADPQLLPPPRPTGQRRTHRLFDGQFPRGDERRDPGFSGLVPAMASGPGELARMPCDVPGLELWCQGKSHVRLSFFWSDDRYAHRLELADEGSRVVCLESLEGADDQFWPPSPPLQQLNVQSEASVDSVPCCWAWPARATGRRASKSAIRR